MAMLETALNVLPLQFGSSQLDLHDGTSPDKDSIRTVYQIRMGCQFGSRIQQ
ncbi:MAG: hypothetical protein KY476_21790 [Planctomycetes bacterium]|nr:hypothetical protein [Planctomycetota bacterium]